MVILHLNIFSAPKLNKGKRHLCGHAGCMGIVKRHIPRLVTLIQAQATPGEAAGTGSAIWWWKPPEEQV